MLICSGEPLADLQAETMSAEDLNETQADIRFLANMLHLPQHRWPILPSPSTEAADTSPATDIEFSIV